MLEGEGEIINIKGLDCYFNSIMTYVHGLNRAYYLSFFNTWSEMELRYDTRDLVYSGISVLKSINCHFGICLLEHRNPEKEKRLELLDKCAAGNGLLIRTDTYYCEWNSSYKRRHAPHYFIVKGCFNQDVYRLTDATYRICDGRVSREYLMIRCNDYTEFLSSSVLNPAFDKNAFKEEILAVQRQLPRFSSMLRNKLLAIESQKDEQIIQLAKEIDGLMMQRYMFCHYLEKVGDESPVPLNPELFVPVIQEWSAVKNGLYKIAVIPAERRLSYLEKLLRHLNSAIQLEYDLTDRYITICHKGGYILVK